MNFKRTLAFPLLVVGAATASAAEKEYWIGNVERQYWVGVQNFAVPDVDSNTYGISGHIAVDTHAESGEHFVGSLDLFYEHDTDHLDFDHIPIRWDVHLGTDNEIWQGTQMRLGWAADINTRMNTVSSIEREITALPAIVGWYDGKLVRTSLKTGAGWFFLEIDDDAPSIRGYVRDDLRNSTFGYSVAADATLKIGACCKVYGQAQQWWDSHVWLQTQYEAAFHVDIGSWARSSEIVLSAQSYEYNLDVYQSPNTNLAVLGWDNDLLIRLSFETKW